MTLYLALCDGRDTYELNKWIWGRAKKHIKVISDKLHALGYDFTSNAGGTLQGNINLYMATHADSRLLAIHGNRFVISIVYPAAEPHTPSGGTSHACCYEAIINLNPVKVEEADHTMQAILHGRRI